MVMMWKAVSTVGQRSMTDELHNCNRGAFAAYAPFDENTSHNWYIHSLWHCWSQQKVFCDFRSALQLSVDCVQGSTTWGLVYLIISTAKRCMVGESVASLNLSRGFSLPDLSCTTSQRYDIFNRKGVVGPEEIFNLHHQPLYPFQLSKFPKAVQQYCPITMLVAGLISTFGLL